MTNTFDISVAAIQVVSQNDFTIQGGSKVSRTNFEVTYSKINWQIYVSTSF